MRATHSLIGDGVFRHAPTGDGWEVPATWIPKTRVVNSTLLTAELHGGYWVGVEDGRSVPWSTDLGAAAERLAMCERGWTLLWDGAEFRASPMLCGGRSCPRCVKARIGRVTHKWVPVLVAAARHGAGVYHITLTQKTRPWQEGEPWRPALVLPEERDRYIGTAIPGEVLPAVSGESLAASYLRFRTHWRNVRQNRGSRELWREALGGYLYGIEWTLRPKDKNKHKPRPQEPRWHCHAHVLCVVPGGWPNFERTWAALRESWCAEVGDASPDAQYCRRVAARSTNVSEESLADSLLEVVKYPIKLTDLTLAAQIEAFASLRGTRPHHVGGALHQASRTDGEMTSGSEPWRTWLSHKGEPPSWPRLQWLNRAHATWEPYSGQVHSGGPYLWRLGEDQTPWEAPADRYWEAMTAGMLEQGYADRDGVLVDMSDELGADPDEGEA